MFNGLTSIIRKIGGRRLSDTMTFCLILSRHRGRMLPACAATLALATAFPVQGGFAGDGIAPRAVAARVGRGPNLDGSIGDECYRRAQRISGFSRLRGGAPPTQKTEAYLVWTKTALYIAMKCYEAKPDGMVAIAKEHDSAVAADDSIQLFLDTNHDHKTYYHLVSNFKGVGFDAIGEQTGSSGQPENWDGTWRVATEVHPDPENPENGYWVAEFEIPFEQVGGRPKEGDVWGLNLNRKAGSSAELLCWSAMFHHLHVASKFGDVLFGGDVPKPYVSIEPFDLKVGENRLGLTVANPFPDEPTALALHWQLRDDEGVAFSKVVDVKVAPNDFSKLEVDCPVRIHGKQLLVLSLFENSELLFRTNLTSEIRPERFVLFSSVSRQPYYSTEKRAEVYVTVNAPVERRTDFVLTSTLRQDTRKLASKTFGPPAKDQITIVHPVETLKAGRYTIDVALRDKAGARIASEVHPIHILPRSGKTSKAEIDNNGVLWVNGKRRFPLLICIALPEQRIAEAGFDGVLFGIDRAERDQKAMQSALSAFDRAEELGIWAVPEICDYFRGKEDYDGLRGIVSRFKDHPALLCWYLADEPTGYGTRPETLVKAKEIIHQIDPNHPVLVLSNNPSAFRALSETCDVFLSDPYGIPKRAITIVGDWTDASRQAMKGKKPVWMCLQAHGPPWYVRYPTKAEIRNMAYQAIIHGALGLQWWAYGPMEDSGWDEYVKLVKEIRHLEPVLLNGRKGKLEIIEIDGKSIHSLTKRLDKFTYLFAANVSAEPVLARFEVNARKVEVLFENRQVNSDGRKFADRFEGYEVHVYKIAEAGGAR